MTKILEFNHLGEKIRSVAIFSLEQSDCSVMIMPYIRKETLGNTIIITRNNQDWISESPIVTAYSNTYLNILYEIDLLLIEQEQF